jgi:transposase-like protein
MGRRARVERTREQKWDIILEGIRRRNIAEMCREREISPTAYYRWKDEARQRATTAPDAVKDTRIRQMEHALERKAVEAEILRKVAGRSCGELHSHARKLVEQGYEPNAVATALSISRSSLYYRNRPRCKVRKAEDPDYRETLLSTLQVPL